MQGLANSTAGHVCQALSLAVTALCVSMPGAALIPAHTGAVNTRPFVCSQLVLLQQSCRPTGARPSVCVAGRGQPPRERPCVATGGCFRRGSDWTTPCVNLPGNAGATSSLRTAGGQTEWGQGELTLEQLLQVSHWGRGFWGYSPGSYTNSPGLLPVFPDCSRRSPAAETGAACLPSAA